MPTLWSESIDVHRQAVRDAILDAAGALVAERGLLAVTMSGLAETTGIGRATLYKYFPDIEAVIRAWHERQIERHIAEVVTIRDREHDPATRLQAVLEGYALMRHHARAHADDALARLLHREPHVDRAQQHVHDLFQELIEQARAAGRLRYDVPADELATYCMHSLDAAADLPSQAAVRRLVGLVVTALGDSPAGQLGTEHDAR